MNHLCSLRISNFLSYPVSSINPLAFEDEYKQMLDGWSNVESKENEPVFMQEDPSDGETVKKAVRSNVDQTDPVVEKKCPKMVKKADG